ncbi:MAG: ROK family transcriptional regulator [Sulfitobacter sp.]|uniref:ROK family transcriptional regulator n=1 Tax=Celeribacter marinus TaxID=1397108 RepID=UPI00317C08B7
MPDMRFAPPNPIRIADRVNGLNAVSVRSHNERLVLALLLQHGGTSRMAIGEKTGLSAQTVSVIVRSLEKEGLVAKGKAQKGRVGPPTIPMSLNPEGAYSVGISIGFRKTEVVLINFVGTVVSHKTLQHETAGDHHVHPDIFTTTEAILADLPAKKRLRVAGIGLALPDQFEDSEPLEQMRQRLEEAFALEVFVQNDVTAAAGGESLFGVARDLDNYLFFYIGAKIHSRLILNHQIYNGASTKPYDVGLLELERGLGSNAVYADELWERSRHLENFDAALADWQKKCVELIKSKLDELGQFVDVKTVVLSSYIPPEICRTICDHLALENDAVAAIVGSLDRAPKAVGAASLPFASRFMV